MAYEYKNKISSTGQIHGNACWAASISWWLSAMSLHNKRRPKAQVDLINEFGELLDYSGAMSLKNIKKVCQSAEIRIDLRYVTPAALKKDYNFSSPCLIIFNYPKVGGTHMNVIFNQSGDNVTAMEPFYPHPGEDGKRTGQYIQRPLSFYCNSEEVGVGVLPLADAFKNLDE